LWRKSKSQTSSSSWVTWTSIPRQTRQLERTTSFHRSYPRSNTKLGQTIPNPFDEQRHIQRRSLKTMQHWSSMRTICRWDWE
jgi:hypothetical protein